ncbi:hypothetical protein [Pontibacter sp. FD36]|uniref:DUF2231 domain-containing protein n=2 Tax=Hymenobacteraceae TaxID=1853232 RepID=A0ABQ1W8K1_9BACT|nr:hypothetical protein [Pontibacter sp. FD36]GGG18543.1 hypothetical protein GCM10011323_23360 [Pontibacter amylolyticus]
MLFILLLCLMHTAPLYAHGGEKHGSTARTEAISQVPDTLTPQQIAPEEHAAHVQDPASAHARPDDFPNKHPLIVHFPIVLLLVAAAVQLCNILFLRKELDWITTVATLISFSTAYYVTEIDHPHTTGLTAHAKLVLEQHDFYADWTIYLGGIGLIAQLLNQFLFKGKRWSVLVVALVLTSAAYCVAMAGHYGAQLVHIEGVGPQGKYLETGHHH